MYQASVEDGVLIQFEARKDFAKALRRGRIRKLLGQQDELLSSYQVYQDLGGKSRHDAGRKIVPVEKIVGSVGRTGDFDVDFNPVSKRTRARWESIRRAYFQGINLPPVALYRVGDTYFVEDGHHRVSVARSVGQSFIDAYVVVFDTYSEEAEPCIIDICA